MDQKERIRLAACILKEHGAQIRGLIRRHVRDENDVDDIYQNVFLALVRTPPSRLTFLAAFLSLVVRNQVTDAIRRTKSYGRCIERYSQLPAGRACESDPEAALIRAEQMQRLVLFLRSTLPPHMADVVVDRYAHNRGLAERAQQFGIKERTASHYCCVAIKRIKRLIDEGKVSSDTFS
jgi:RNA polymerase sigma factor (sigma-70 family)